MLIKIPIQKFIVKNTLLRKILYFIDSFIIESLFMIK